MKESDKCTLRTPFPSFLPNPNSILLGLYEKWAESTECTLEEKTIICAALKSSAYACSVINKPKLESISYTLHSVSLQELSRITKLDTF